jgi:hypothetical protein
MLSKQEVYNRYYGITGVLLFRAVLSVFIEDYGFSNFFSHQFDDSG